MKRLLWLSILVAATPCMSQNLPADRTVDQREATRCGIFYLLIGEKLKGTDRGRAHEFAARILLEPAMAKAGKAQFTAWNDEFLQEFLKVPKEGGQFDNYLTALAHKCEPTFLLGLLAAAKASAISTGADKDKVVKWHEDRRPAEAVVAGDAVTYTDSEGTTCAAPIVQGGSTTHKARLDGQYIWLADQHPSWKIKSQSAKTDAPVTSAEDLDSVRIFSELELLDDAGKPQSFCFDVTTSARPELLKTLTELRQN